MNIKNYKTIICIATAVALLGTVVFCGIKIYSHYQQIVLLYGTIIGSYIENEGGVAY